MSQSTNPTEERPSTKAEAEEDVRVQHFHRVYGRSDSERNTSQKFVVSLLEQVLDQQTFQQNPRTCEYDPYHAAQREGERSLARAILSDIKREPVSQIQKPPVKK